jgi:spore coat polysaccharide biosynthesis protein SpsF
MVVGQSNKVVAIVQARMQSTRLPGKVLMPMPFGSEFNLLLQIINQIKKLATKLDIVIATTEQSADDQIVFFCKEHSIPFYRGDQEDVHSRFIQILKNSNYNTAIRLTGDNVIIDLEYLNLVLMSHMQSNADYSFTSGLPVGMNFEVFNVSAFLRRGVNQLSDEEKEHVTLIFKTDPSFISNEIKIFSGLENRNLRTTIDHPSDYLMISTVFELSKKHSIEPGLKLIKFILNTYPWLFNVNESNIQRTQFRSSTEEIAYAASLLKSLDLKASAHRLLKNE